MSRQPKRARSKEVDEIYNARKRLAREGLRYLEKSQKGEGVRAARNRVLAEQRLKQALSTYDPDQQKRGKYLAEIRKLSQGLNINLTTEVEQVTRLRGKQRQEAIQRSYKALEGAKRDSEIRRENEAQAILNNPAIGSRIYAGLVSVWREEAKVTDEVGRVKVDNDKINELLMKYFKTDSLAGVLDKLEQSIGDRLYDMSGDRDTIYEIVKLLIQQKVADNTFVQ